eukprot:9155301-Lingulodinium_polyedra.AAC.1
MPSNQVTTPVPHPGSHQCKARALAPVGASAWLPQQSKRRAGSMHLNCQNGPMGEAQEGAGEQWIGH